MRKKIFTKDKFFRKRYLTLLFEFLFNQTAQDARVDGNWSYKQIIDITKMARISDHVIVTINTQYFIPKSKLEPNYNNLQLTNQNNELMVHFLDYSSNTSGLTNSCKLNKSISNIR